MRVCLDTNVLVSAFATRGLSADVLRLVLSQHDLVLPDCVAEELERILVTKFKVSDDAVAAVRAVLARVVRASTPLQFQAVGLGDPDDEVVLASALAADVEILITGDRHFLENAERCPIPVLNPRSFWELLSEGTS